MNNNVHNECNFLISTAYDEYVYCTHVCMYRLKCAAVCVEVKGQTQVSVLACYLQTGTLFFFCSITGGKGLLRILLSASHVSIEVL